jgi:hypothetical protein
MALLLHAGALALSSAPGSNKGEDAAFRLGLSPEAVYSAIDVTKERP